jgi:UDP-N-acetylglucosamine:LPS N-acetylglucosamine transferase
VLIDDAECTPQRVEAEISRLREQPHQWRTMAENSRALGRPDAAAAVVELIAVASRDTSRTAA